MCLSTAVVQIYTVDEVHICAVNEVMSQLCSVDVLACCSSADLWFCATTPNQAHVSHMFGSMFLRLLSCRHSWSSN